MRRVNTRVVIDMVTGRVELREFYPWAGPWALATNTFAVTQAAYRFYNDDGSESAATVAANENTAPNFVKSGGDKTYHLRIRLQESGSGSASGATTDDYQLQYAKNGGAFNNVTTATTDIKAVNSTNLTDAGATTQRLTAGTGSFIAGKISEDGLLDDHQLTADNYTEHLYTVQFVAANLAINDVITFRVLRNGATFTYSVTPTVNVAALTSTSQTTGNWNSTGTWDTGVVPGDGDLAVIASGHTVTITQGNPVTIGTSGADGTVAITLVGSLVCNDVLTVRGDISQQRTSTVTVSRVGSNTGGITFDPASTRTYKWITPNTGTGTPSIILTGESGDYVSFKTDLGRGGNRMYCDFSAYPPTLDWDWVSVLDVGGTGDTTATRFMTYVGVGADQIMWTNVKMNTYGRMHFTLNSADFTFDWQNCDFRAPRNTAALQLNNDTAKTSGIRQVKNCTAHNAGATHSFIFWAIDFVLDGGVYHNTVFGFDIQDDNNKITGNCLIANDVQSTGGVVFAGIPHSFIVEDTMFLSNCDNPHYVALTTGGARGVDPIVRRCVVDGCGFVGADAGDFCLPDGPFFMERCLLINRAGSLFSGLSTTQVATVRQCTLNGVGTFINAGESVMAATNLARISSCLFVGQPSALMYDTLTAQSGFNLDYNGFWNQTEAGNFDHPTIPGNPNSYLEGPTSWWTAGTYGDDDKGLHDKYADPEFADPGATSITWYNDILGSGGSYTNIINEMIKLNGTAADGTSASWDTRFNTLALLTYLRNAFQPQNHSLYGAGDPDDGSPSLGAVDVDPPPEPPQISIPRKSRLRAKAVGADAI